MLLNLAVIVLLWKELKLSSFDPALATSMGFSATLMHYLLMALVAVTTVASFEAVGSILVVAMLIVPPATAHLLVRSAWRRWCSSPACSQSCRRSSAIGLPSEPVWNVDPAGAMAVVAGGMYGLAVLFSPQYGILSTLIRNLQTALRILREDLLLDALPRRGNRSPRSACSRAKPWPRSAAAGSRAGRWRCSAAAAASKSATASCT